MMVDDRSEDLVRRDLEQIASATPITRIDIVYQGRVLKQIDVDPATDIRRNEKTIVPGSGWLVVQKKGLQTGLPQTIVAMISSNMARSGHPSRVTVRLASPESQGMGLHTDSVVMPDNLAMILDTEIDRTIGQCQDFQSINDALRHALGW